MSVYLPAIPEFQVFVFDRGIPNAERIVLRAEQVVQMESLCLTLGIRDAVTGSYAPIRDHFFWFGGGVVQPTERVLLYTGPGTARKTTIEGSDDVAYILYWGKESTVLAEPSISPLLMKFGEMTIADPPQLDLPQAIPTRPPLNG